MRDNTIIMQLGRQGIVAGHDDWIHNLRSVLWELSEYDYLGPVTGNVQDMLRSVRFMLSEGILD